jgi:4-hydroxy-tetrahydrodipicolinate synthase
MAKANFSGVLVPAITPYKPDLSVDAALFGKVCHWLMAQGANGLAVFGTTSEANSLTNAERKSLLEGLVAGGIDPSVLLPGTGECSLMDTVDMTKHAVSLGCGGVLMLPPFYYKPVSDDGLFAFYSEVIERVGSSDLGLWLYHIPQMAGVGVPHDVIERLIKRYPTTVLGIKDSSGNVVSRWSEDRAFDRQEGFTEINPDEYVIYAEHISTAKMKAGQTYTIEASLANQEGFTTSTRVTPRP